MKKKLFCDTSVLITAIIQLILLLAVVLGGHYYIQHRSDLLELGHYEAFKGKLYQRFVSIHLILYILLGAWAVAVNMLRSVKNEKNILDIKKRVRRRNVNMIVSLTPFIIICILQPMIAHRLI